MPTRKPVALPMELWIKVLESLKMDRVELWMSMRHVCKGFMDAIEVIFRNRHLPKTFISIPINGHHTEDGRQLDLRFDFKLSRLSEDSSIAIFNGHYEGEPISDSNHILESRLVHRNFEAPLHTVQIRKTVNDTPVPGFSINYETLELSFDWRGLYTWFYAEQKCCEILIREWSKSKEQYIKGLQARLFRGELTMDQVMTMAVAEFASSFEDKMDIARRARIRRQYKSVGADWNFDNDGDELLERTIREELTTKRKRIKSQEFSDDEEEEIDEEFDEVDEDEEDEEDDEEEEDGEADSWEDTDGDDADDEPAEELPAVGSLRVSHP